ncbi:LuxR C-terminal-related transcriptional regulator [Leucobacter sp. GX24907]
MLNLTGPLRLRLLNDFEIVVAGLRAMLAPFEGRIRVVESDLLDEKATSDSDLTLYDTFGKSQFADSELERLISDPLAGAAVVYSWNTHPAVVNSALEKGCRGYIDKSLSASELVDLLERVAAGEVVVPLRRGTDSEGSCSGTWPGQREGLSEREAEIVTLITRGHTNSDIATRLYITGNSVKTYIRSAYRKMGVERRSQAVRWGLEHGMIPPNLEGEILPEGATPRS